MARLAQRTLTAIDGFTIQCGFGDVGASYLPNIGVNSQINPLLANYLQQNTLTPEQNDRGAALGRMGRLASLTL
jgi:hypothetical protein